MTQITKKQHYIWRSYLAPWTNNNSSTGTIACLRNKKIFPVSLINIAHENYFYGVKKLSDIEREIIYKMFIENVSGVQREVNESWLNLYCASFDLAEKVSRMVDSNDVVMNRSRMEDHPEFKNFNVEFIEKTHSRIEHSGMRYLELVRENDLSFWKNEDDRNEFSFFLCSQYFRTKRTRDAIKKVLENFKNIDKDFDITPENMWLPISLIGASNVGAHVAQDFIILLQAEDGSFIVGDQPVVNTHSTFDALTPSKDMELFYPVTPHTALFFTKDPKYASGQTLKIGVDEVDKYNRLEVQASREQCFAKNPEQLEGFLTTIDIETYCQ